MSPSEAAEQPELIRGVGLAGATTLNMIDMIGVGPFITIPLIVSAAGGPQAMLGWIAGAVFALCDGLVWAELGAAMPERRRLVSVSERNLRAKVAGTPAVVSLHLAAFVQRAAFDRLRLHRTGALCGIPLARPGPRLAVAHLSRSDVPLLGSLEVSTRVDAGNASSPWRPAPSSSSCSTAASRRSRKLAELLWVGVAVAIAWIIFAGLTHFSAARAFDFPPGAFHLSPEFFTGMGAAMLIATYDYWGYYNVCFLGGEVKDPGPHHPACAHSLHRRGRRHLHRDEHQRAGRGSLARDDRTRRRPEQLHHLGLHAAHLRQLGGPRHRRA